MSVLEYYILIGIIVLLCEVLFGGLILFLSCGDHIVFVSITVVLFIVYLLGIPVVALITGVPNVS
jgi:hypothetical protein